MCSAATGLSSLTGSSTWLIGTILRGALVPMWVAAG
jgi:hypothetical protein